MYSGSISVTPVPEPEAYAMLLAGLGLMGAVVRRRSMRKTS
ncbi:PEP-CTERM sorting domain-containing protein [Nitrosospira lacus]|uniref:PEP-CTERM sorting domain-containing protein n=1 Tax=Nitrosospira lacus TaxID=1288494 RepID=A0A1W6ST31_9PROT|nr:PEP-CTERM sorting domain-containing protein [Nitrosospira lacus]